MKKFLCKTLIPVIFFCSFLFSCKQEPVPVYLFKADSFLAEKAWIEEIIKNDFPSCNIDTSGIADIWIDFFEFWNYEDGLMFLGDEIIISKTWFVPKEDSFADRKNTTLDLCKEGKEKLIPIDELNPPDIALRVDGFSVGDDYPLVRNVGFRIKSFPMYRGESKRDYKKRIKIASKLEVYYQNISKPLISEPPTITWISSAGDVMLGRGAGNILLGQGSSALFGRTYEILSEADITIINLEGPLSARGTRAAKTFTFRFEPPRELAAALKNSGIDTVLFANNHTFDFGDTAFLDTLNYLGEAGIGILGAGRNLESILQPWRFTKGNFNANFWGIASFPRESTGYDGTQNVATEDKPGFLLAARGGARQGGQEALIEQFEKGSLNVVLFHGGAEWSQSPVPATRELYTGMARAGADLIIGSHPHIVQGFEWIDNEKLIFWSLGNFVFAGMENTNGGDEGLLIRLGYLGKQPVYIEPFAVKLTGPRADLAPDEKLATFYQRSRVLLRD